MDYYKVDDDHWGQGVIPTAFDFNFYYSGIYTLPQVQSHCWTASDTGSSIQAHAEMNLFQKPIACCRRAHWTVPFVTRYSLVKSEYYRKWIELLTL